MSSRLPIQDFCIDAIKSLQDSQVPTLWAITDTSKPRNCMSSVNEVLKSQCYQALRLRGPVTESQVSIQYSRFQTASTRIQWLALLKSILVQFKSHVFLILDMAAILPDDDEQDQLEFIGELRKLAEELPQLNTHLHLKILVFAYEPKWLELFPDNIEDHVIPVRTIKHKGRVARGGMHKIKLPCR